MRELTLKGAKQKAWKAFSDYVRKRDAVGDYVACFTCDTIKHWKEMQAGHFKHGVLDFDEINIHGQCVRCNKYLSGNLSVYAERLIYRYGVEEFRSLCTRAYRAQGGEKKTIEEYIEIEKKYKALFDELEKVA